MTKRGAKTLYALVDGMMVKIAEKQKSGKPKLIDIGFGSYTEMINDYQKSGYKVTQLN